MKNSCQIPLFLWYQNTPRKSMFSENKMFCLSADICLFLEKIMDRKGKPDWLRIERIEKEETEKIYACFNQFGQKVVFIFGIAEKGIYDNKNASFVKISICFANVTNFWLK